MFLKIKVINKQKLTIFNLSISFALYINWLKPYSNLFKKFIENSLSPEITDCSIPIIVPIKVPTTHNDAALNIANKTDDINYGSSCDDKTDDINAPIPIGQ